MEKCRREVLERSVIEKCWSSQHRQEMPTKPCLQPPAISNSEKNGHKRTVAPF